MAGGPPSPRLWPRSPSGLPRPEPVNHGPCEQFHLNLTVFLSSAWGQPHSPPHFVRGFGMTIGEVGMTGRSDFWSAGTLILDGLRGILKNNDRNETNHSGQSRHTMSLCQGQSRGKGSKTVCSVAFDGRVPILLVQIRQTCRETLLLGQIAGESVCKTPPSTGI